MAITIEMWISHVGEFTKCGALGMNPKRRYWKTATPSATDAPSTTVSEGQTCYPYTWWHFQIHIRENGTETMSQA